MRQLYLFRALKSSRTNKKFHLIQQIVTSWCKTQLTQDNAYLTKTILISGDEIDEDEEQEVHQTMKTELKEGLLKRLVPSLNKDWAPSKRHVKSGCPPTLYRKSTTQCDGGKIGTTKQEGSAIERAVYVDVPCASWSASPSVKVPCGSELPAIATFKESIAPKTRPVPCPRAWVTTAKGKVNKPESFPVHQHTFFHLITIYDSMLVPPFHLQLHYTFTTLL